MLNILITIALALLISILSFKAKFLTPGGSVAQFSLALLIFGLGGIKWSVPIITFFLLSSILSKFRKNKNEKVDIYFEKSGQRDHWQVLANGGIAGLIVTINYFYTSELFYLIYVSCISAVCADTWATEIGTLRKRNTYNILNFNSVEQGKSGGISVSGTAGAILGAFIIPLSAVSFMDKKWIFPVAASGLLASLIDSILGASIQAQYFCSICGKITEHEIHCEKKASLKSGFQRINNDAVNFICSCAGGIIIVVFKICL